jgi:hypothetical protein
MMIAATAPFVRFELRHFGEDEEEEAWNWLGARERKAESQTLPLAAEMMA